MQYVDRSSVSRILTSTAVYTQTFSDDPVDLPLPHAMPALPDAYMQEYEIFMKQISDGLQRLTALTTTCVAEKVNIELWNVWTHELRPRLLQTRKLEGAGLTNDEANAKMPFIDQLLDGADIDFDNLPPLPQPKQSPAHPRRPKRARVDSSASSGGLPELPALEHDTVLPLTSSPAASLATPNGML